MFAYIIKDDSGGVILGAIVDNDDAVDKVGHCLQYLADLFLFVIGGNNDGDSFIV